MDWNESADNLVLRQIGIEVETVKEAQVLVPLNQSDKILVEKRADEIAHVSAVTTRYKARLRVLAGSYPGSGERATDRVGPASKDEEPWIAGLKEHLVRIVRYLTQEDSKIFGSIVTDYEETAEDRDTLMRLAVLETNQQAVLDP
ncbi:LOW QUALITY PROTEIN: reverse transcriptase [Phytophthora megakarya]|uniref:Reverse transcriptase n=1 Tax=Phytophthora megakarya TaxID=4795 RepID=A0A225WML2_9STRA|nr:LOW QUALITY PROTEIN: reverse transcriptase [Phytophthora megakarya]